LTVGGFMFWGLFLVLAAILAAYVCWMLVVERHDGDPPLDVRSGAARQRPDEPGA
jgi:hypothetical protein